jgi:hypothetical protein
MLFRLPTEKRLWKIKNSVRNFESFYLASLKNLIQTFERVALWCDHETAGFLRAEGLDKKIMMRVLKFSELPHYRERARCLNYLRGMEKFRGRLLKRRTPEDWPDYLTVVTAKPAIIDWAAEFDKFGSDYFMWIDAGSMAPYYAQMWGGVWTGKISARPKRCRFCIYPVQRLRPRFVPKFIYRLFRRIANLGYLVVPATAKSIARQDIKDIAMINADYDVPGGAFIIPKHLAHEFNVCFESARALMKKRGLCSVEQAVFQVMMKLYPHLFEVSYTRLYEGLYAVAAKKSADHILVK